MAHETATIDKGFSDSFVRADLIIETKEEMNDL